MSSRPLTPISSRIVAGICTLGLAAFLAACAGDSRDVNGRRVSRPYIVGVDVNMVNTVLIDGFTEINDRSFEQPDNNKLFIAGISSLKKIDPAVDVNIDKDKLYLTYRDRPILNLGSVEKKNVEEWSLTTLRAIIGARRASNKMREADPEAFYKAIFNGALAIVDPYSRYSPFKDAIRHRLVRDGVIGLGVRLEFVEDGVLVQAIVAEGPGELAGLKLHDVIVRANGASLTGLSMPEVRRRLDGTVGTTVSLSVRRPGVRDPIEMRAALDLVVADTVTSSFTEGVLEIKVGSFTQRSTMGVEKAVREARESGQLKGVVLDLRGDPGGLLDQAVDMADLFLETGTIATLHGRHPSANQYYAAGLDDVSNGAPLAVIIDAKSASAAEIAAAALHDNGRALLVGTTSWGKGSVQNLQKLPNGGELTITWARVKMPRGVELHGLGLMPDICLSGTPASVEDAIATLSSETSARIRREWREAADSSEVHDALRTGCPAEPHVDRPIDMEVARRLVADDHLYAAALAEQSLQIALSPW